jgi:hypothetical protein
VESASLTIVELLINGDPSLTGCATALTDDVQEVESDHAEEPGEDNVVHSPPMGESEGSGIRGDMVVKGITPQRQQDEVAPTGVVAREVVEDDGDQGPNVLDIDGLGMEVGDGGGLVCVIGVEEGVVGGTTSCCSTAARSRTRASTTAFSCCHTRVATCSR